MKTPYVITWGSYGDVEVVGVVLGKKAAKKLVRRLNERDDDEYDFTKADYLSAADVYEVEVHRFVANLADNGSITEPVDHTVEVKVGHPAVPVRGEGVKAYSSATPGGIIHQVWAIGDDEVAVRAAFDKAIRKAQEQNIAHLAAWNQLQAEADQIYEHMVKRGEGWRKR